MKRISLSPIMLAAIVLLFTGMACKAVTELIDSEPYEYEEGPDTYNPYESENPAPIGPSGENEPPSPSVNELVSCPQATEKILKAATAFYEEDSNDESRDEPEETYLITYNVLDDQIGEPSFDYVPQNLQTYQYDEATHQEIWNYFITLIPLNERDSLAEYSIVTDGEGNVLAAVTQTTYDPALWALEVDILDSADKLNLTYTLIHEYAHLLTLGPDQVTPNMAVFNNPDDDDIYYDEVSACPDYFPGEGCSQPDSYVNAFFNQFWVDIDEEWQDINLIEDDDAYYDALDDFYYKYEDRFVTDYAATNPEEDLAEVFTFFILSPRPTGDTIAEEKILFFYDYPELVQLRDEIISGICSLNP